jgi:D-methionine transport system substrate-binding protein
MQRRNFLKYALAGAGAVSVSALTGCGLVNPGGASAAGSGGKIIKIIVTESAPYQEPTKIAQKLLEAKGWTLEPTYVTDIIQPNLAVANGEFDANFFQHNAYLRQFNQDKGLENVGLFYVYSAPGGIWSDKYKSLAELPDGAKIGIPVDPANNGRALFMLRDAGLLELSEATVISEKAAALKAAYQSPEVKAWYASYQNGILPTPWDQDPSADVAKL